MRNDIASTYLTNKEFNRTLMLRYRGRCTHCGCKVFSRCLSEKVVQILWSDQHYVCYSDQAGYVRLRGIATVEHIIPRSKGGNNYYKNITLHCSICNHIKNVLYRPTNASKLQPLTQLLGLPIGRQRSFNGTFTKMIFMAINPEWFSVHRKAICKRKKALNDQIRKTSEFYS